MFAKKYRIAVIDDEQKLTKLLKMILEDSIDCKVEVFNDSLEALERLKEVPFDAISMDYRMPNLMGMDIVKFLRSHPGPNNLTKILLLTGFRDQAECADLELLDQVYFQEKPVDESRFLRWINFMLKAKAKVS